MDGKTSRRGHDRADDKAPPHLVSAFATTSRLALGQEAVEGKSNELSAIPVPLDRLSEGGSLKGALVSIDAIAANAMIARAIADKGADYPLAVKANQPTPRAEIESAFAATTRIDSFIDPDKGHGRIEQRGVSVLTEVDWPNGERRFPGEPRPPNAATIIRVKSQAELSDRGRFETRYYLSSARLSAKRARPREAIGAWRTRALGARRRLRRGSIPPAQGPRRARHGRRQAFRGQSCPRRPRARPRARASAADEAATQGRQA